MTEILAEFVGTAMLLFLGNGVVANVLLKDTKGHDTGLIVITIGWAMALFVAVFITADISGAHLNPAVTVAFAMIGEFSWSAAPGYIIAQMLGGAFGAFLVWLFYKDHFAATEDPLAKLSAFCNTPAIRKTSSNLISEALATFVLVFAIFYIAGAEVDGKPASLGSLNALPVALLLLGIGLSLGGTTGYAINPARDFSPRIMHALLPIPGKKDSDWSYSWIPVVGPMLGGVLAALVFLGLN